MVYLQYQLLEKRGTLIHASKSCLLVDTLAFHRHTQYVDVYNNRKDINKPERYHQSIGILSSLLVEFESNPIKPVIDRNTPIYGMLQCVAAHAPSMDHKFRKTILKSAHSDVALRILEKIIQKDVALMSFIGTTQAIDLIQGGVKTNALPEQAWAVVNHRIATQRYSHNPF